MPGELESELPQIDPKILIFLLYMVILQELVSGWMEYKKLACKPKKKPGPVWSSSLSLKRYSAFLLMKRHPYPLEMQVQNRGSPDPRPAAEWSGGRDYDNSYTRSSARMSLSPLTMSTIRRDRGRDYRKPGRIFRKA